MKKLFMIGAFVSLTVAAGFAAVNSAPGPELRKALAAVPIPELPAKAAELIRAAKPAERNSQTIEVMRAALLVNPGAAVAIVGAVAREVPDMAAVAAATAAEALPNDAEAIARAAAMVAPSEAGRITAAVCRAVPGQYRAVAAAVAAAAPSATRLVLQAVASVFPELKGPIDAAMDHNSPAPPAVVGILERAGVPAALRATPGGPPAKGAGSAPARLPRGPSIAPPFIPLSGTPTNANPANSGNVPRGHRDYAAP